MNSEKVSITLPTGKVEGLAYGDRKNPAILAIHGWLDNAASFTLLASYLKNYRVLAFDLPGHGFSEHYPKGVHLNIFDYATSLIYLLHYLPEQPTRLLGHSLGAALFTLVAGTIPRRITHLGLIDALGPFTTSEEKMPEQMEEAIVQFQNIEKKKLPKYNSVQDAIKAKQKATPMHDSAVKLLIERGLVNNQGKYVWRTDARLTVKPLFMLTENQIIEYIKRINAKTCLIKAKSGWPFPSNYYNRTKYVKHLEKHELNGSHYVHMEQPELVGSILDTFFSK